MASPWERHAGASRELPHLARSVPLLADFPAGIATTAAGGISLDGWLAQWAMTTLLQPLTTIKYMHYLGYAAATQHSGDATSDAYTAARKLPLKATRSRSIENQENELQRDVVRCFVFGGKGCGKTALLEALRGGPKRAIAPPDAPRSAARFIQPPRSRSSREGEGKKDRGTRQRCLVITECPANSGAELEVLDSGMVDCDLAILMFDVNDPGSVEHLAAVQSSIPGAVPCVYLANKCDTLTNVEVPPPAYLAARDLCARHNLADPERLSLPPNPSKSSIAATNRMFQLLLATALRPDAARPLSDTERSAQRGKRPAIDFAHHDGSCRRWRRLVRCVAIWTGPRSSSKDIFAGQDSTDTI